MPSARLIVKQVEPPQRPQATGQQAPFLAMPVSHVGSDSCAAATESTSNKTQEARCATVDRRILEYVIEKGNWSKEDVAVGGI